MKIKHFVYTNIPNTKYRGFGLHFKPNDTEINKILMKLIYDFKVSKELDRLFLIYKNESVFIVFLKHIDDLDENGRGGLYIAHGFIVKKDRIISLSDLIKKLQKISFKSLDEIKTSNYIVFEAGLTQDIEIENNHKEYSFTEEDKIIYFNILKSLETDNTLLLNSDKFLDFIDYIPKKFELFLYTNFDDEKIKFNLIDKKPNILTYQNRKPRGEYMGIDTEIMTKNIPNEDIEEWYEIKDKKLDIDRFLSIKSVKLKIFFLDINLCNSLLRELGINGNCNNEIGQYFISEKIKKEIDILKNIRTNNLSLKEFVSISCQKIKEYILYDRLTNKFLSDLKLDVELQKSKEYFLSNDIIKDIEDLYRFQTNKTLKNFIRLSDSLKEFLLTDILCEYFINELQLSGVELQKSKKYFLSDDIVQDIEDLYRFQTNKTLKNFIRLSNSLKEFLLTPMLSKYFLKELKVNVDIEFEILKSIFLENRNIDIIKARLFDYLNKINQIDDDILKSKFLSLFFIMKQSVIQNNIDKIYSILDSLEDSKNISSLFKYLQKQNLLQDIVKLDTRELEIINNLAKINNLQFLQNLIEDKNSLKLLEKIKDKKQLKPIIESILNPSQDYKEKKSKLKEIKKLFGIKWVCL